MSDNISNMDDYNENNMYAVRNNPNRLKNCRVCENCGIEFSSWKSFLEHGKCNSEHEEGPLRGHNSSKRKRSYRASVGNPSSEEEDLAHCLIMLSNGIVEPEDSCASAIKDEAIRHHFNQHEKAKGLFECKACKKVFNSHQALGGHRASHKKVKGCFAAHGLISQMELDHVKLQYDHNGSSIKKKAKVHECSICYRVFSSGQALGGHKRCHWITSKHSPQHTSASVVKFYDQANVKVNNFPKDSESLDLTLDLNFHALDVKSQNNQIPQDIFLLPLVGSHNREKDKIYVTKQNLEKITNHETETKTKSVKLMELKEMNSCQTSSQWLQVGLGSTSTHAGNDI